MGLMGPFGNRSHQGQAGLLVPNGRYRLGVELFTSIFIITTSLLFFLSDGKLQMTNFLKLSRIHSGKENLCQNHQDKKGLKGN